MLYAGPVTASVCAGEMLVASEVVPVNFALNECVAMDKERVFKVAVPGVKPALVVEIN